MLLLKNEILRHCSIGYSTAEVQKYIGEEYETYVPGSVIDTLYRSAIDAANNYFSRSLNKTYPIVRFNKLWVRVREKGMIHEKVLVICLGIGLEGRESILGTWVWEPAQEKFWWRTLGELKNRGIQNILIARTGETTELIQGLEAALEMIFPGAQTQFYLTHMVRVWRDNIRPDDRTRIKAEIKKILSAETLEQAEELMDHFGIQWNYRYPTITLAWQINREKVALTLSNPKWIREVIYFYILRTGVTFHLESANRRVDVFDSKEETLARLKLTVNVFADDLNDPLPGWEKALSRFMADFGDRLSVN